MRRRSIILPLAVFAATTVGPPLAAGNAQSAPRTATTHVATLAPSVRGSARLTIARLPAQRRTIAQLATFYYGSSAMSFVILAANPWLGGYPLTKPLASNSSSPTHRTVNVPSIRYPRPLGPQTTNARTR
jgi:hypothetical protein